jgi:hypothetical protein
LDKPFQSGGAEVAPAFNIGAVNPRIKTPYMQQWNISVEHEVFKAWSLRLSYVGARTTQIIYSRNINKPPPSLIPFSPDRYNYPGFIDINWFDSGGNSNYHALQFQFTHRWSNGLLVDGLMQYQSEIADVADTTSHPSIENPYDRRRERAKALIDPLDFRTNFIWEFPFGPGKRFGSNATPGHLYSGLIGGWQFSGIVDVRSGRPETVYFSGSDPSNTNTFGGRATLVPGCNTRPGDGKNGLYLNINCFKVPDEGDFGNAGRDIFRKQGFWDFSGSLYKYFKLKFISENLKLRFSMTAANIFNHPTYRDVGNNISDPASFGRLSYPGGAGRPITGVGLRTMYLQGQVQW